MFEGHAFRVHYAVLEPNRVVNLCGPQTQSYIDALNARSGFYDRLLESVAREGFRNPILVTSGRQGVPNLRVDRLPPGVDPERIVCCDRNGGSRLWVAGRLGMAVPCLISDWTGAFADAKALPDREAVLATYRDPPERLIVNDHGLHVVGLPHHHLGGGEP